MHQGENHGARSMRWNKGRQYDKSGGAQTRKNQTCVNTIWCAGEKLQFENLCQFIYELPEKITHQAVRLANMFWFF